MRQPAASPAAWKGDELFDRDDFLHEMDAEDIDEIRTALARVDSAGLDLEAITPETFPLPRVARRLARIQESLEDGSGAALLRGWPASAFDLTANRRVHWGLTRHLGTPVSQSAQGEKIFHVANQGFQPSDPRDRGPNSSRALRFHSDRCDVLSFLCVRPAQAGGDSFLVSTPTIHDEILSRRPDLLEELYGKWYYKTPNVDRANPEPWCHQRPVPAGNRRHSLRQQLHHAALALRVPGSSGSRSAAPDLSHLAGGTQQPATTAGTGGDLRLHGTGCAARWDSPRTRTQRFEA